jgi:hypothetical protein
MAKSPAHGADHVYAATERWVEVALQSDGSLFSSGRAVWAAEPADELRERFILNPDMTGDSFEAKLEKQLSGASPEAVQLMAEILFVHLLPAQKYQGSRVSLRGAIRIEAGE